GGIGAQGARLGGAVARPARVDTRAARRWRPGRAQLWREPAARAAATGWLDGRLSCLGRQPAPAAAHQGVRVQTAIQGAPVDRILAVSISALARVTLCAPPAARPPRR